MFFKLEKSVEKVMILLYNIIIKCFIGGTIMLEKVDKIIIGIRLSKSFRIVDITGELSDEILYSKDSPFKDIYESLGNANTFERVLKDENEENSFKISPTDMIVTIAVKDNFEDVFKRIDNEILPFIEKSIFKKFNIKNVMRLGIVYSHTVNEYHKIDAITKLVTNNGITEPNNFRLSFSKKKSSGSTMLEKNNYTNTIYTIEQNEDKFTISLDYQDYFQPIVEDIRDCNSKSFLKDSHTYLTKKFYTWVLPHGKE